MILAHNHFDLFGKVILEKVVFKAPLKSNSTMRDEACFLHVLKGNSSLYTPVKKLEVKTSDSLVMKCGSYLNKWFGKPDEQPNEAVLVHFYPEVLQLIYEDKLPDFIASKSRKDVESATLVPVDEMIANYVRSLLFYFDNPGMVTTELIKLKVKEIILLLVNTENSSRINSILTDLFHPNNYEFKEVIHAHLYEDLSIPDLAVLCGYSLSSFKRKFTSTFGLSPTRYINSKRMERAKELLRQPNLSVSEIAYDCGFKDLSYFSKMFSATFQYSPSKFRKLQLN